MNIPGFAKLDNVTGVQYQDVSKGNTVLFYQPPAPFELDEDDDTFKEQEEYFSLFTNFLWLIEQFKRVEMRSLQMAGVDWMSCCQTRLLV